MGAESFAVIVAGGRQHRVVPGEVLRVDRLSQEKGAEVTFDQVLLCGTESGVKVGSPTVPGAAVRARVLDERRDRKVLVFRYRKTKQFRKMRGHREWFTLIRVEAIEPGA